MLDYIRFSRIKRKVLSHTWAVRTGLLVVLLASGVMGVFLLTKIATVTRIPVYFHLISKFASAPVEELASEKGRTNILIMGKAGGDHSGPELTDTMLVASVSLDNPSASVISIPRDTWIPEAKAKINSAYYYGKIPLAKSLTGEVVGVPVHYAVLIDFSGFTKIIDILGGIEVNVERSFTDAMYPISGKENDTCGGSDPKYLCRYETISFNAGEQTMDGTTALKFVRSRHAEGTEGTDIAREARQQEIIGAIKNKILNPHLLLTPKKDLEIYRVVKASIETDITPDSAVVLARKFFDSRNNINSFIIPEGLLINPPISKIYDNQYVFIPKAGNGKWDEIHKWVASIL